MRSHEQLLEDVRAIWRAGVRQVDSRRLVLDNVRLGPRELILAGAEIPLAGIRRLVVVGGGKAGAGMSAGLEQALANLPSRIERSGWLNVPADCVRPLEWIHLHPARPAGVNEPTEAGVAGTRRILELVRELGPQDLCICLLSGGGSALLPAPVAEITLEDKQRITRYLSGAGANIQQLNTVRKQLSLFKGGRLAAACRGRLVTLIISDVIGDPLDVIASGPTVPDSATPQDALRILDQFGAASAGIGEHVFTYLRGAPGPPAAAGQVDNFIIGNNALAVDAAGMEAERRGYSHAMAAATRLEGAAEDVGRHLASMARRMLLEPGPDCLITGGEPTVQLVEESLRGKGGRNQQLALAALDWLLDQPHALNPLDGIALLSGGTDGEDGPTTAAGAVIHAGTVERLRADRLDPKPFLRRNDAYHFFQPLGDLLETGPTHTNVCDLRVVVVARRQAQ